MIQTTLSALADPTRRGVVRLLRVEPRRAGDLAQALNSSPPAMSRHLKVLRRAGLVEPLIVEEDARGRVYRLRVEPLSELRTWVEEVGSPSPFAPRPCRPSGCSLKRPISGGCMARPTAWPDDGLGPSSSSRGLAVACWSALRPTPARVITSRVPFSTGNRRHRTGRGAPTRRGEGGAH